MLTSTETIVEMVHFIRIVQNNYFY